MLPWDGGQGRHGEPQRRGGHHGEQGGGQDGGPHGGQHGGHDHDASYEPYVDTSSCNTMAYQG